MQELQGGIIGAAVIQVGIGYLGIMGWLLQYISPLTIAPTIALVGLALVGAGVNLLVHSYRYQLFSSAVLWHEVVGDWQQRSCSRYMGG